MPLDVAPELANGYYRRKQSQTGAGHSNYSRFLSPPNGEEMANSTWFNLVQLGSTWSVFAENFYGRPEVFWAYLRIGCYDLRGHFYLNHLNKAFSSSAQSLNPHSDPLGLCFLIVPCSACAWTAESIKKSRCRRAGGLCQVSEHRWNEVFHKRMVLFIVGIFVMRGMLPPIGGKLLDTCGCYTLSRLSLAACVEHVVFCVFLPA